MQVRIRPSAAQLLASDPWLNDDADRSAAVVATLAADPVPFDPASRVRVQNGDSMSSEGYAKAMSGGAFQESGGLSGVADDGVGWSADEFESKLGLHEVKCHSVDGSQCCIERRSGLRYCTRDAVPP